MANINLLGITPHQVSRDLRGYSVFFYGQPKAGKTTVSVSFPRHLLLAFEKGYSAIPGAMAQPVDSWAEFKKVLKQLKDPQVQQTFETIIVDTGDLAYLYCREYILKNYPNSQGGVGVDKISDIPYGQGYGMIEEEFDRALRTIVQLNYGLVIISHSTEKTVINEQGQEYNRFIPTLDARGTKVISRMADIIGFAKTVYDPETNKNSTKLFMRDTPYYMAGSRFKYTPDYIDFSYNNLVKAIQDAIDKQAEVSGEEYFTNEKENLYKSESITSAPTLDESMAKFNALINDLITKTGDEQKFVTYWEPRITTIIERHLGKGRKVSQCSIEQADVLELILIDLEEMIEESQDNS